MSSDNIRAFLDKKSHEAVSHYSLTEIKKDELLIGTPDDTVLDPEYSKEYYLKSFHVGENRIVIKTIGIGKNRPVSVYINDKRWELFPGPDGAKKEVKSFIESGEYTKWIERLTSMAAKEAAKEIDKEIAKEEGGAGDEGTDKLVKKYKNDTPGETGGVKPENPLPENVIQKLEHCKKYRVTSKIYFSDTQESVTVNPSTADVVLRIRESLNNSNKAVYDSKLKSCKSDFLEMVGFGMNNIS